MSGSPRCCTALVRLTSYVNAPDELSADVAVVQLQRAFAGGVLYLDNGWQQIVDGWRWPWSRPGERSAPGRDSPAGPRRAGGDRCGRRPPRRRPSSATSFPRCPSFASSLDLGLRQVPPHHFVIGVDEPIYLSDHGRPAGMTPDGATSVSLAEYLTPGVKPDRGRLEAFARRAGIAAEDVVEARYLHRMTTVTAIARPPKVGLAGRADAPCRSDRACSSSATGWGDGSPHRRGAGERGAGRHGCDPTSCERRTVLR